VSGPGTSSCGAASESCCISLRVTGGTYSRTYTNDGTGATGLADSATVSSFRLDKYSVTVGRFRQFVSAWNGGWMPPAGSGKHTHLNGGMGLANSASSGTNETGWVTADNANIAPTDDNLACDSGYGTWTSTPSGQEAVALNCVTWYEARAFCIWDGGFLPSEAEWEYAAAGGSQQREYPWGTAAPGMANQYAIYGCYYPSGSGTCNGASSVAPVGTATLGAGLWGQLDLAGDVWQWTLDSWASAYVNPCVDCAYVTPDGDRVFRGGSFGYDVSGLLPPLRSKLDPTLEPTLRDGYIGFRCARTP
jgi:formylglycine-generating enzyme required for sulfatase activity